ncbi:MAG: glycosyltransferase family 39 protein [Planctomycetes bacterium]|nr:glycosyltransferase family 39 protein [Planctomycetota bacterium]
MKRYRGYLGAILGIGLVFRVGVALALGPQSFPDSGQYKEAADGLRSGKGLVTGGVDRAVRMPGYPVFLAGIRGAFGTSELPVRLAQTFFGVLTAWLAAGWLRPRLGDAAALAAAAILALDPFLAYFSALELVEVLEGFMLLGTLRLACRAAETGKLPVAAAAGGAAALTALVHPSILPVLALAGGILVPAAGARKGLALATAFFAAFAALYAPWIVRNAIVLRAFVPATTQVGTALFEAFGPGATGGISRDTMDWPREVDALPELERNRRYRAMAGEAVRRDPARAVALAPRKWAKLWNPAPNAAEYRGGLLLLVSLAWNIPLYLLALAGAWLRRREPAVRWSLLAVAGLTLVHAVFLGSLRYRMPVMPEVGIAAAAGLAALAARFGFSAGNPPPPGNISA